MSIELSAGVNLVCEEIARRCKCSLPPESKRFRELLNTLDGGIERFVVARFFCRSNWNIGSLRVLAMLQDSRVLTATEYILSLHNAAEIQLILNDFLEADFELLTNLLTSLYYDSANAVKLSAILNDCLHQLFADLLENPRLNDLNYLQTARELLPPELLTKVAHTHIHVMLELHSCTVAEAFRGFSQWVNEGVDHLKFPHDCYAKLFGHAEEETLSHLFEVSAREHFSHWKFYIILLQTIASKCGQEATTRIRKYLRSRFRQVAALPCKDTLLHLLLTVRATTASTCDAAKNVDNYADWYKQNIADMKFVLSAEEFQNVVLLLEQCIEFELEEAYLEVHAVITISPPVLCGKLVQAYKSKCKQRLAQLKRSARAPLDPNASILIDDSD